MIPSASKFSREIALLIDVQASTYVRAYLGTFLFPLVQTCLSMPLALLALLACAPQKRRQADYNACDQGHANDVTTDTPRLVSEAREISVQTASLALGGVGE